MLDQAGRNGSEPETGFVVVAQVGLADPACGILREVEREEQRVRRRQEGQRPRPRRGPDQRLRAAGVQSQPPKSFSVVQPNSFPKVPFTIERRAMPTTSPNGYQNREQ